MSPLKSIFLICLYFVISGELTPSIVAQESNRRLPSPLDSMGVWQLTIALSDQEFAALEPATPQFQGFGGPVPAQTPVVPDPAREAVANFFGIRFPWVHGTLSVQPNHVAEPLSCRLRYDGDFTYMMAGTSPKRPMFVELLEGGEIQSMSAFRLHTMQIDPTLMRERIASHVFSAMGVPAARVMHAELTLSVEQPSRIGLYAAVEVVDAEFLKRHGKQSSALIMQTNGLNAIQYLGDAWPPYVALFRSSTQPSKQQQDRMIAFAKLIDEASDKDFAEQIGDFIDSTALLRYVAANALLSNLTGFSSIGANDTLCLDADGKFTIVATEMEVALGGAVLSGTAEQLTSLRVTHPYAGECKLVERLLSDPQTKEQYLNIVREAAETFYSVESMAAAIDVVEAETADARQAEAKAAEERARQTAAGLGSFGGGPPPETAPMSVRRFVEERHASIVRQLTGDDVGYLPAPPNFGGGFGGGGGGGLGAPSRQGAQAPISQSQFTESVQAPPEFSLTLFAKSPEVNYPVAIAAEPSGAIYVASDEQGSLGTDKGGGKVLRCVDANGDGVMDSVTTFCRADHVRGVVYRGGAVWVCHPPYLTVFHDDNADGVADRSQTLVSGLTSDLVDSRGGDHTTNGVRMGIDGWLYIGDGDYGIPQAQGVDGSTVVLRGGGIVRVRPDGTELELFCSGLRNPFDIAIDPQLNMFTRDNTNDGGGWDTRVSQLFQSAEYGYPRLFANFSDEIMPTLGVFGNGGGTGSLYIDDDSWPKRLNRSLLTGDWGRSAVFHHPLQADGPTYQLTQEPFLTIPRATGMDIDAAGNLYVASWWSGEASVYVGPQVGFVARVSPKDAERGEFPQLSRASVPALIELLNAREQVARFHVQGELIRRGGELGTVEALKRAVSDPQFLLDGRIAALFAVKQIEGEKSHEQLKSWTRNAELREFAIRALTDRKSQLDGLSVEFFTPFLSDPSTRVVAQTLIALGRLGDRRAAEAIIPLAFQARGERPDAAVPNATQVLPSLALRALIDLKAADACLAALDGEHWMAALRALRSMHTPQAVDGLLARLLSERDIDKRNEILTTLVRLYQQETPYDGSWWGIRPDTTGPYYDPMLWAKSEQIMNALVIAAKEADAPTAEMLSRELMRHQVPVDGIPLSSTTSAVEVAKPIAIEAIDPLQPNQLGNLSYDDALVRTLAIRGSASAGELIFKARNCNACHTSTAGQQPLGPHLAEIGKRYKTTELIESILKPSEKIAQGYETQMFSLDSGQIVSGFVIRESSRHLFVRDNQGVTHQVDRDAIEDRAHQKVSAMPEGIVGSLEPKNLADLIAYLQSL